MKSQKKTLSVKLFAGVRKRKSGKFCAEIKHPFNKKMIWLGTFITAEEASKIYKRKKLEFEELMRFVREKMGNFVLKLNTHLPRKCFGWGLILLLKKLEFEELVKIAKKGQKIQEYVQESSFSNDSLMNVAGNTDLLDGVEENSNLFVGEKQESCSDEELVVKSAKKVQKIQESVQESSSSNDSLMNVVGNTDLLNGVEEKSNLFGEEKQETKYGSDDEDLLMGQWIQIGEDKEVKFSLKLGVPIVDNYGFLLGEFSILDDLGICM